MQRLGVNDIPPKKPGHNEKAQMLNSMDQVAR